MSMPSVQQLQQLQTLMDSNEDEHLEFKEAKNRFDFEELTKYCVALANERGGKIIFGVTDRRPRRIVGCQAFPNLESTKQSLIERLHLRVDAETISHPDGLVIIFHVPSRPLGMPMQYRGAYWMRGGESLVPMTPDMIKRIFDEAGPDFSAEICPKASISHLHPQAIFHFRTQWARKSGNTRLSTLTDEQLLADSGLLEDKRLTYAALILFGTSEALDRFLPQAELILEYRLTEASGPPSQRREYRRGFFLYQEDLWQEIDLRNDNQHFQEGLFVRDIRTFNEIAVREAVLNAVSHRDYRLQSSVFVRQYPRRLEIVSPGGWPPGIRPENILWQQAPRNRRLAEAFAKCGLVERSGQGMNRMFEESIKEGKPRPDFTGTEEYWVFLKLRGDIQEPRFLRVMEQIGLERLSGFSTEDFLVLDHVYRDQLIPEMLRPRLSNLMDLGIVEAVGRGKGVRYILARRFYRAIGKSGVYTRQRGLDRETNKALLLKHIKDNAHEGSPFHDLQQVLPGHSRGQVQELLRDLKQQGLAINQGHTKAARWYPTTAQVVDDGDTQAAPLIEPDGDSTD